MENSSEFSDIQSVAPNVWKAVKDGKFWLLKTSKGNDTASKLLLRREYELSCNLQHPFIATSFMYLEESPVGCAIMIEYVAGQTLREFISENPDIQVRRKVFGQIMDATEYLHRNGLLHNDIKPDNIMVTAIGRDVKIIDFGLAESDSDYLNRHLGGTLGYSAPEVISGSNPDVSSASSDIYALGVIMTLLFPKKYIRIRNKCRRSNPQQRYPDITTLRKAISRATARPFIISAIATIAVLAAVAIIPDHIRYQETLREENITNARVRQIQQDLSVFYTQAVDSIADRSIVPYRDFADIIRNHFVNNFVRYKESVPEQEMQFVCDTIYARLIRNLSRMMLEMPYLSSLHSQGLISDDEYLFYDQLYMDGKPYTTYRK